MPDSFRQKLIKKDLLVGPLVTLPSPEIAEILSETGFDWLFIDMEHAPFSVQDVQRIVQVTEGKCPCVVRVPSNDDVWIKKVLDTGADGVLIPHVNSPEEAHQIIRSCKYPPEGMRSAGLSRAQGYGLRFREYVENANDKVAVILQIEDVEGVRNIDAIVKIPGVDAVFVGPYDLSGSMGKIGKVTDDDVLQEIDKVRSACLKAGVAVGVFGIDVQAVKSFIAQGYTLIALGTDSLLLIRAAKETLKEIRD